VRASLPIDLNSQKGPAKEVSILDVDDQMKIDSISSDPSQVGRQQSSHHSLSVNLPAGVRDVIES
jgi:hypothetical protein